MVSIRMVFDIVMVYACTSAALGAEIDNAYKWKLWTSGLNLRGANIYQEEVRFDGPGHRRDWYPNLVQEDLARLRDRNANLVVLSVPGPFEVRYPWGPDPWSMERLDRLIHWSLEEDLFVVIACRTGPGRSEEDITHHGKDCPWLVRSAFDQKSSREQYMRMWEYIARTYRDMDHVLGYELMVEPHAAVGEKPAEFQLKWEAFASAMVVRIRRIDSSTPILVSPHA